MDNIIYSKGIITIGDVDLNLTKFEGDVNNVQEIRDAIGNLTLLDNIKVNKFYQSKTNTYEYNDFDFNDLEKNEKIQKRTNELIKQLRVNEDTLENALQDEVFMQFVTTVTIWSKILTCIYVLFTVSVSSCTLGSQNEDKFKGDKDKEIEKLKKLLVETSNLLFSMDNVEDININQGSL